MKPVVFSVVPTIRTNDERTASGGTPSAAAAAPPHEARAGTRLFLAAVTTYVALGVVLVFRYDIIPNDAISRVGNAFYVLFSRDPHLAAIGFLWNPLPSLAMLPLLPLAKLWPALTERPFAGSVMSAVFMAGAVHQMWRILSDLALRTRHAVALTLIFALHPMILYYGANGMSEAPLIFSLLLATRSLGQWLHEAELRWLVRAGAALALAYLARYEVIFSGVGAMLVVGSVTYFRTVGDSSKRRDSALADVAVLAAPIVVTVLGWALASYIIVGHPFQQFSSIYGNSSQVALLDGQNVPWDSLGRAGYVSWQLLAIAPFLFALVGLALLSAFRNRDLRSLAGMAVVGSALAFQIIAFLTGQTFGFFRYYILAVPLVVLLGGALLATAGRSSASDSIVRRRLRLGRSCLILACVSSSGVAGGIAMRHERIAPEESIQLAAVVSPGHLTAKEQAFLSLYDSQREAARYLDRLRLPNGSVLVDTFHAPAIVLSSSRPKQFIITSDRDFHATLADPGAFAVRFLLTEPPVGLGGLNALNRAYPALYDTGGGIGELVAEFGKPGWRLYKIIGQSPEAPPTEAATTVESSPSSSGKSASTDRSGSPVEIDS